MALPEELVDELSRQYGNVFQGYNFSETTPVKALDENVATAKKKLKKNAKKKNRRKKHKNCR